MPAIPVLHIDPRLIDAVVEFTGAVQDVAADLVDLGVDEPASRLCGALDRLNAVATEGRAINGDWPSGGRS